MNEISLQPGRDTHFGCGGSPFLDGQRGVGSDAMWRCDDGPSTDGTESAQQLAMTDIMSAAHTHNPGAPRAASAPSACVAQGQWGV